MDYMWTITREFSYPVGSGQLHEQTVIMVAPTAVEVLENYLSSTDSSADTIVKVERGKAVADQRLES